MTERPTTLPKLLIVDDEPAFRLAMGSYLSRQGFTVRDAESIGAARASLATSDYAAMLLDLSLPDGDGLDWIDEVRRKHRELALVVITGRSEIAVAVEAMRRGADHFVTKPVDPAELVVQLRRFMTARAGASRAARPRGAVANPAFFGDAPATLRMRERAEVAANTSSVVLITGETGSGKGVLARWIHENSPRRNKEFIEVNCSAMRGELLANELFGHTRGAFTSAVDTQPGLLDAANGGTLFLDEIGDMDLSVQAQLLKTIEEKRYRRLGEVTTRSSDFRIIGATNHALDQDVAAGRFRSDLFYRINVLPIRIPPLRDRLSDLPMLAKHLLRNLGDIRIEEAALAMLTHHDWPGNVRELRNVLERAALLAEEGGVIRPAHLDGFDEDAADPGGRVVLPAEVAAALERNGGDKVLAARELGISRATLYRRLKDLKRPA